VRAAFLAVVAVAVAGCSAVSSVVPHHGPRWKTIYDSGGFTDSTASEVITVDGQAWFDVECHGDVQRVGATITRLGASLPLEELGPLPGATYTELDGPVTINAAMLGAGHCTVQLRVSPHATWSVAHGAWP
jgi:hypothetical protein